MKFYVTDQSFQFEKLLEELKSLAVMTFEKKNLVEKISSVKIDSRKKIDELDLAFFFDYQIFPKTIMKYQTQWELEKRSMRVGDTVLQQVNILPFTFFPKIIFGARITSIIAERGRKGFSYTTLEGHAEKGESIFVMEQTDEGIQFRIRTFSVPGNWLTRILAPIFSVPYQSYCTRKATKNVRQQMKGSNNN